MSGHSLSAETLRPYVLRFVSAGRYSVRLREQPWLPIGDVIRLSSGPDCGMWRGVVWDETRAEFTVESLAVFCYRWEAVGFLARYRALAKEIA